MVILGRVFILQMRFRQGRTFCCKVMQATGEVEVKGMLSRVGPRSQAGFLVAGRLSRS